MVIKDITQTFGASSISFEWQDFWIFIGLIFVFFPWIAIVLDAVLWFFGIPPMTDWDTKRAVFAVVWPFMWGFAVASTN